MEGRTAVIKTSKYDAKIPQFSDVSKSMLPFNKAIIGVKKRLNQKLQNGFQAFALIILFLIYFDTIFLYTVTEAG